MPTDPSSESAHRIAPIIDVVRRRMARASASLLVQSTAEPSKTNSIMPLNIEFGLALMGITMAAD